MTIHTQGTELGDSQAASKSGCVSGNTLSVIKTARPVPGEDGMSAPPQRQGQFDSVITTVLISALVLDGSPRRVGFCQDHVDVLAALPADQLPPILLRWPTNQVIDGTHRVRAALHRGEQSVQARFVSCSEDEAFLMSVEMNNAHGLPLSLADREFAAQQIVIRHPDWSDRRIGSISGLSAHTVAAIRKGATEQNSQLPRRIGLDGRVRPVSGAEGRRRSAEYIAANPASTLREIAEYAGVSTGTARDVRNRIRSGMNILPPRQREAGCDQKTGAASNELARGNVAPQRKVPSWSGLSERLGNDPTLRYTNDGRAFLRWIDNQIASLQVLERYVKFCPPRWSEELAGLARYCSGEWLRMAHLLAQARCEGHRVNRGPGALCVLDSHIKIA
ncbi:MAG TPA: ParB N-terminal domain-containing protein [Streptosporangiaceae bacterium]|nr:ParB N-terminal domain-containing protein [Streptosporangiaceae bacterium]